MLIWLSKPYHRYRKMYKPDATIDKLLSTVTRVGQRKKTLRPYLSVAGELIIENNLLMHGSRIVIPSSL